MPGPGATTAAPTAPEAAVFMQRRFPVPREEVFRAWTEPELFRRWFGAPGGSTPHAEMDVRPGGRYRIEMRRPLGVGWTTYVVGEYLEVAAPERLTFTFGWERPPPPAFGMERSRVTVLFEELNGSTEVRLTHELLDKRRLRAFHGWGWRHSFGELERLLGNDQG